jgi:hypothetical protein
MGKEQESQEEGRKESEGIHNGSLRACLLKPAARILKFPYKV